MVGLKKVKTGRQVRVVKFRFYLGWMTIGKKNKVYLWVASYRNKTLAKL